jgi:hypothetical protein
MYARSDISPERGARLDLAAPKNESRGDSTEKTRSSAGEGRTRQYCAALGLI